MKSANTAQKAKVRGATTRARELGVSGMKLNMDEGEQEQNDLMLTKFKEQESRR